MNTKRTVSRQLHIYVCVMWWGSGVLGTTSSIFYWIFQYFFYSNFIFMLQILSVFLVSYNTLCDYEYEPLAYIMFREGICNLHIMFIHIYIYMCEMYVIALQFCSAVLIIMRWTTYTLITFSMYFHHQPPFHLIILYKDTIVV